MNLVGPRAQPVPTARTAAGSVVVAAGPDVGSDGPGCPGSEGSAVNHRVRALLAGAGLIVLLTACGARQGQTTTIELSPITPTASAPAPHAPAATPADTQTCFDVAEVYSGLELLPLTDHSEEEDADEDALEQARDSVSRLRGNFPPRCVRRSTTSGTSSTTPAPPCSPRRPCGSTGRWSRPSRGCGPIARARRATDGEGRSERRPRERDSAGEEGRPGNETHLGSGAHFRSSHTALSTLSRSLTTAF